MTYIPAVLAVLMFQTLANIGPAHAQTAGMTWPPAIDRLDNASLLDATYLLELKQGSYLSSLAGNLGSGGFETATGNRIDFRPWYRSRWTEASITWMTQISQNLGVIHGFSTGERGPKYTIFPAFKLGVMMQTQTGHQAFLSLRLITTIGGELREKPCSANYGEIGGVQTVNCRLAATPLPPAQTLSYLLREKPPNQSQAMLLFTWQF